MHQTHRGTLCGNETNVLDQGSKAVAPCRCAVNVSYFRFTVHSQLHRSSHVYVALIECSVTICELGKEWEDPTKIPVNEIVDEWRTQSSKGRYETAMCISRGTVTFPPCNFTEKQSMARSVLSNAFATEKNGVFAIVAVAP